MSEKRGSTVEAAWIYFIDLASGGVIRSVRVSKRLPPLAHIEAGRYLILCTPEEIQEEAE